jgi:hypothetical protein
MESIDDPDILHWNDLINEHKRTLKVLERQAAQWGKLHVPPYVTKSIEDARKEIDTLEQNIRRRIKNANTSDVLRTNEEIDAMFDEVMDELRSRHLALYNKWYKSPFLRLILVQTLVGISVGIGYYLNSWTTVYFVCTILMAQMLSLFALMDNDEHAFFQSRKERRTANRTTRHVGMWMSIVSFITTATLYITYALNFDGYSIAIAICIVLIAAIIIMVRLIEGSQQIETNHP